MRLTLYVDSLYTSPFAFSVYVALREMGLDFDLQPLNLEAEEQHRSPFRERSITARIPTLRHDDFWLSESAAICEYLHEEFAASGIPIYPAGIRERARARQVQGWLRSDLAALRSDRPTEVAFLAERRGELTPEGQKAADKLVRVAGTLVGETSGPLFGHWTVADIELALMLNRLVQHGDPVPSKLERYARAEWARPSVQDWCALARAAA